MKPELGKYEILSFQGMYYVLSPYDLMARPALKIVGCAYDTYIEAFAHLRNVCASDLKTYERLKSLGRSFPDNS
jgi:hypothetical protein